jgi:hypothetical protein
MARPLRPSHKELSGEGPADESRETDEARLLQLALLEYCGDTHAATDAQRRQAVFGFRAA